MLPDEGSLELELTSGLGLSLAIEIAGEPLAPGAMTRTEHAQYLSVRGGVREESWLRGRAALKGLLQRLERTVDTSSMSFPNERYSLTHSGPYAVACGTAQRDVRGMGIDLEVAAQPSPDAARLFLTPAELAWLSGLTDPRGELVRLWTIKEALFKADLHNGSNWLTDYELIRPAKRRGEAVASRSGHRFRYASLAVEQGAISVATRLGGA